MAPTIIPTVTVPAAALFAGGQPLDLVGLADVKLELNITNSANDAWLKKVITRASRAISVECTRVFQPQGYQEQFYAYRDPYPWQLPSGFFPLQLSAWPLSSPPSLAGTAPPLAPTLSAVAGGSISGTFYARATYVTPTGETAGSMEASLSIASGFLRVTAPIEDNEGVATGWNCYLGMKSYGEMLQNSSPLPLDENFTLPTSGLVATGAPVPNFILVVENNPLDPQPLAEGIDFISDYDPSEPDFSKSWLTRLFLLDETPRRWSGLPILVNYQAGYPTIPDDLSDACLQLVKAKWFARTRDPMLRSENVAGVYEAAWWFASGPGSSGQFPPDVEAVIDRYRVPTIA